MLPGFPTICRIITRMYSEFQCYGLAEHYQKEDFRIEKLGSQVDIPTTLLDQLGITGNFPFGKDLLSDESKSFAFYTYNEGFGFITDSSAVGFDLKAKSRY